MIILLSMFHSKVLWRVLPNQNEGSYFTWFLFMRIISFWYIYGDIYFPYLTIVPKSCMMLQIKKMHFNKKKKRKTIIIITLHHVSNNWGGWVFLGKRYFTRARTYKILNTGHRRYLRITIGDIEFRKKLFLC